MEIDWQSDRILIIGDKKVKFINTINFKKDKKLSFNIKDSYAAIK